MMTLNSLKNIIFTNSWFSFLFELPRHYNVFLYTFHTNKMSVLCKSSQMPWKELCWSDSSNTSKTCFSSSKTSWLLALFLQARKLHISDKEAHSSQMLPKSRTKWGQLPCIPQGHPRHRPRRQVSKISFVKLFWWLIPLDKTLSSQKLRAMRNPHP